MLMMLAYVGRARAPRTQASSAQLGLHFSRVRAFDASLQIHTHIHIHIHLHVHIHLHMHFIKCIHSYIYINI